MSTPKVMQAKERAPTPYYFDVFTLDLHLSLSRSLGARQLGQSFNLFLQKEIAPHINLLKDIA